MLNTIKRLAVALSVAVALSGCLAAARREASSALTGNNVGHETRRSAR